MRTRTGALVGNELAERFGWRIGDKVPLGSLLWTREDGAPTWTFDVLALANANPGDEELFAGELYFHYAYLDEARAVGKGTTHQYIVRIANSAYETTTLDDKQYLRSQLSQVGDLRVFVNSVLGAVLFTLLFLTGTTLMQPMREIFQGDAFSFGGGFRQVAMRLEVGPGLSVIGVAWDCAIALLGGLLPALRAARLPVAEGLRVSV